MNRRYLGSFGVASAITFGLFLVMQFLVAQGSGRLGALTQPHTIDFVRLIKDTPVTEVVRNLPPRPEIIPQPPGPPVPDWEVAEGVGGIPFIGPEDPIMDVVPTGRSGLPNGDELPMVRVAPRYPPQMQGRGIEGFVVLDFTISKTGAVIDPTVIYAEPGTGFNRAAIRALLKWKYKPLVVDGIPRDRPGMRVRISFEMPKG